VPLAPTRLNPVVFFIPHARLTLYIPRESLDAAKNEARLRASRSPIEIHPLAPSAGSEWQGVELRGEANVILETAERIERIVEEVDDCVLAISVTKVGWAIVRTMLFCAACCCNSRLRGGVLCRRELRSCQPLTTLRSSASALHLVLASMCPLTVMLIMS
jgi:hypothetical protein